MAGAFAARSRSAFSNASKKILRQRHGRPDLGLSDYFDLIGGTSTGAIITSALAIGMSAEDVEKTYLEFGGEVFNDREDQFGLPRLGLLRGRYDAEPLQRKLADYFGDRTLGDDSIRTGLCIVAKRADTSSVWPLINHPGGRYYPKNRQILLRDAVRASTAAQAIRPGGNQYRRRRRKRVRRRRGEPAQ